MGRPRVEAAPGFGPFSPAPAAARRFWIPGGMGVKGSPAIRRLSQSLRTGRHYRRGPVSWQAEMTFAPGPFGAVLRNSHFLCHRLNPDRACDTLVSQYPPRESVGRRAARAFVSLLNVIRPLGPTMKMRKARRLGTLTAGAWITLLVGGLVAPSAARAGCTHYVLAHGQGAHSGLSPLDDLELLSEAALHRADGPLGAPLDHPSPCSGLSCSRDPMPPMAPAPAGPLRVDAWACLNLAIPLTPAPLPSPLVEQAAGRPVHLAFPPDRPPRSY